MADTTNFPDAATTVRLPADMMSLVGDLAVSIGNDTVAQRIRRLKARFMYCWSHPKWTRWRREAKEDLEFVSGVGQWDEAVKRKLESEGRPALSINEVRPVVQIVVGYERNSRLELKPIPEGKEDLEDVTVFGKVMHRAARDEEVNFVLSETFKDQVIGGLGVCFIGVDYSRDLIHGRPVVEKVRQGEFVHDPGAQRYDMRDARDMFWSKMVPVDALLARYPDKAEEIRAALGQVPRDQFEATMELPPRDPHDGYRTESFDALPLYDELRQEVRVVEAWYRVWEPEYLLVDRRSDRVDTIPAGALDVARKLAQVDPEVKLVTRQRQRVEMSVFLPATNQELDTGNGFENDDDEYPFVRFIGYEEGDEILGLVRNLKDPQREINKRRSALSDNASRHGNIKWFALRSGLENPEALEHGAAAGDVFWIRAPGQEPKEIPPRPLPEWVAQQDLRAKDEIKQISGVNADLQGQSDASASGIARARSQAQGQIAVSELFDNYRRSRRLVGKRFGKRVQQVYTGEMTVRLDAEAGETEFVTLNQKVVAPDGTVRVLRNIPSLAWDVEIIDSPSTPTARAAAYTMLLDLVGKAPHYLDLLADLMMEFSDLPQREEIVRRIRGYQQAKGILVQGQPGPGAPPPGGMPGGGPGGQPAGPAGRPAMPPNLARMVGPDNADVATAGDNGPLAAALRMMAQGG